MKNFTVYLGILFLSFVSKTFAQETFETRAKAIALNIERITKEEKAALKTAVEVVNEKLDKGMITAKEADDQKLALAQEAATKIETRVSEEESKLAELVKQKVEGRIAVVDSTKNTYGRTFGKGIKVRYGGSKDTIHYGEKRTTSQLVYAAGVNNLVTNNSVAGSDFRYWGSHFYEIGWTFNTRIFKEDNLLHFKYGTSIQYNNLRPTDNRFFVENGTQTDLQTSGIALKDSRFRNVNIVMPLYLEFDFSGKKMRNDKAYYKIQESFRLGLGGFAGFNIKTKQILNYEDTTGNQVTEKTKGDFNTNDFVYGLGAYIGYKNTSLYVKYDLNPLFKNNVVDQNNISLGVRFDLN